MNQFVTYNSGGRESQIDFLMCRRCHLKEVIHCKVINGEAVTAQHRVLVMDWEIQRGKKIKPEQATPRIKWWRLREDNLILKYNSGRCWIKYDQWRVYRNGGRRRAQRY